eukprot:204590-Chlamydomonas_euryale.AAC.1
MHVQRSMEQGAIRADSTKQGQDTPRTGVRRAQDARPFIRVRLSHGLRAGLRICAMHCLAAQRRHMRAIVKNRMSLELLSTMRQEEKGEILDSC